MFTRHYDYGVYFLCVGILALLAIIPMYRVVMFMLKKDKGYLRFTEYFAAIGLFLSNLLGLSHFRASLLDLEHEGVVRNFERITANTIQLGVRQDFNLMLIEFFASVTFFVMLFVVLFLKSRSSTS